MELNFNKMLVVSLTVFMILVLPALPLKADGKLNLVCNTEVSWCELMENLFEKETGIDVSMVRKSTGETLAQIRAEAQNPKIDVWWGGTGDPHAQAAEEGLTAEYTPSNLKDLRDWAVNMSKLTGGRATGIYSGALGIAYNEEIVKSKGFKVPKCWKDLADPSYLGEVRMADPNSSGTAYTALATLTQIFGEEEAFKLLAAIDKNINQYTKSGSAPAKAVARGETTFAIAFQHDMVQLAIAGFPIKIVSPCEGTGYEIGAVSIIKGARNLENAKKWVEFALRADIQSQAGSVGSFQLPSNSKATVPKESPDLSAIKLINYDFKVYGSTEVRKGLISRWTKEIKK